CDCLVSGDGEFGATVVEAKVNRTLGNFRTRRFELGSSALFAGPSVLKTHGVVSNLALDQFRPPDTPYVIFFLAPTLAALDGLCEYIDKSKADTKTLFEVFFIPEAWYVVREKLKELNGGKVPLAEFENNDNADPFALKEIHLNDEVFYRLKHVHINAIGFELAKILAEIKEDEEFDRDRMSVAEYQVLVKKMPQILLKKKLCSVHMRLAEMARAQLYESFADYIRVEKELLESAANDKVHPFIEELIISGDD
ncbi:hypothetical protein TELCIR_19857, partial [Teladorsagia circumcincta]